MSRYSAVPEVRAALVAQQRQVAEHTSQGLVAEGRDLGTVVFPDALLKVYLTADVSARAQRRAAENAERGHDATSAQPTSRWPNVTAPTVSAPCPHCRSPMTRSRSTRLT